MEEPESWHSVKKDKVKLSMQLLTVISPVVQLSSRSLCDLWWSEVFTWGYHTWNQAAWGAFLLLRGHYGKCFILCCLNSRKFTFYHFGSEFQHRARGLTNTRSFNNDSSYLLRVKVRASLLRVLQKDMMKLNNVFYPGVMKSQCFGKWGPWSTKRGLSLRGHLHMKSLELFKTGL